MTHLSFKIIILEFKFKKENDQTWICHQAQTETFAPTNSLEAGNHIIHVNLDLVGRIETARLESLLEEERFLGCSDPPRVRQKVFS